MYDGLPAVITASLEQVSDQETWQMRSAIINLMRNHMVLVIKDKIFSLCDFSCS